MSSETVSGTHSSGYFSIAIRLVRIWAGTHLVGWGSGGVDPHERLGESTVG